MSARPHAFSPSGPGWILAIGLACGGANGDSEAEGTNDAATSATDGASGDGDGTSGDGDGDGDGDGTTGDGDGTSGDGDGTAGDGDGTQGDGDGTSGDGDGDGGDGDGTSGDGDGTSGDGDGTSGDGDGTSGDGTSGDGDGTSGDGDGTSGDGDGTSGDGDGTSGDGTSGDGDGMSGDGDGTSGDGDGTSGDGDGTSGDGDGTSGDGTSGDGDGTSGDGDGTSGDGDGDGDGTSGDGDGTSGDGDGDGDGDGETTVWPLAGSSAEDADVVRYPYGPRYIGQYDFHAGIDIPAALGTPVHTIRDGTVWDIQVYDGSQSSGNRVIVEHADNWFSAYLHLDSIGVTLGQPLAAGDAVGAAGSTGATWNHLHLGVMVGLTTGMDERRSRNPLQILPHSALIVPDPVAAGGGFEFQLPVQTMSVQSVELADIANSTLVDYLEIVALGAVPRDDQSQFGLWFDASAVSMPGGTFTLTVRPDPTSFVPTQVRLWDYAGALVYDGPP